MQPPVRQKIRRVRVAALEDLEDQLWPVNLVIVILAGFVTGLVLATSRFDEPRVLHNAFFQLGTVALTLVAWFLGVRFLRGRMKQRLKVAVLFSLLVHLWLLMGLGVGYYKLAIEPKERLQAIEEVALMTVPDYSEAQMERPDAPSEYHRPSEARTPDAPVPETQRQEIDRPQPSEKAPAEVPEPPRPEQIDPLEVQRRELTAPRRAEELAGQEVSRQEWKERPEPDRPIPAPEIKPADQRPAPVAKIDPADRRQAEAPRTERRTAEEQVRAAAPQDVVRPDRRAARPEPKPDQAAASAARVLRPAEVPQTEAKAPEPARAAEEPRPPQFQPRELALRPERTAPTASKQSAEPREQAAPAPVQSPAPQRNREWLPEIARTPDRVPARQPRVAQMADLAAAPQPEVAAAPQVRVPLAPSSQARADRREPALAPAAGREMPAESPSPEPGAGVAVLQPPRAAQPAAPSLRVQAGPPDRLAARASVSPRLDLGRIDQAPSREPASPGGAADATRMDSLASQQEYRSAGLPGAVQTQAQTGAITPVSGAGSPLLVAAARRARASQQGAEGMNVAPDATALLPRARPGARLPSAAEPLEEPSLAGAGGPAVDSGGRASRPEAGSNTAVERRAPGAPVGRGGATPGQAEFTATPGPVGVMAGQARQGGFGAPALSAGSTAQIGRSDTGAAGLAGLGGTVAQDVPGAIGGAPAAAQGAPRPGLEGNVPSVAKTGGGALPGASPAGMPGLESAPGGGAVALAQLTRPGGGGGPSPGLAVEGGLAGPVRKLGRLPSADVAGEVPEVVGQAPASGGRSTAGPSAWIDAGTAGLRREPGTLPGPLAAGTPVEGATQASPAAAPAGIGAGLRRAPEGEGRGPSLAADLGAKPLGRSVQPGLPSGTAEMAVAEARPGAAQGPAPGAGPGGPGEGDAGRQGVGLPVRVAAMPGAGGLALGPSPEVGLPSRRAQPESEVVHVTGGRFVLERTAGRLAIDARAQPAEAFRQRDPSKRGEEARKRGGTEESERAVEMGLEYLAKTQFPDGRWSTHRAPEHFETWPGEKDAPGDPARLVTAARAAVRDRLGSDAQRAAIGRLAALHESGKPLSDDQRAELAALLRRAALVPGMMESDSAATGLALLSFLGAGYTHREGKHGAAVTRALDWMVANQKDDGDLFGRAGGSDYTWLYSHGIASIALCEAYGMTRDDRLKGPAERAIGFIVRAQHPTRGGWRYAPGEESDTSVSGWQLMALRSAQMAGLDVPRETLDRVSHWLDLAQAPGGDASQYVYNPFAEDTPEQRHGRVASPAMTAEALLMRMYQGWGRGNPLLDRGAARLQANLPEVGTLERPTRDAYYWYYATQVMFQMEGGPWEAWNGRLRPLLVGGQVQEGPLAGSWHPDRPVPDRWGHAGGRHYVSTMNLLMLEVYYRHLPLFKTLREE